MSRDVEVRKCECESDGMNLIDDGGATQKDFQSILPPLFFSRCCPLGRPRQQQSRAHHSRNSQIAPRISAQIFNPRGPSAELVPFCSPASDNAQQWF